MTMEYKIEYNFIFYISIPFLMIIFGGFLSYKAEKREYLRSMKQIGETKYR